MPIDFTFNKAGVLPFLMNASCQATDANGNCIQCYKGYSVISGSCYKVLSVSTTSTSNLKREQMDPLCEEERNGYCTKCTPGTYMSKKTYKCTMKDPFAEEFDENNEIIVKCVRGYALINGCCARVKWLIYLYFIIF